MQPNGHGADSDFATGGGQHRTHALWRRARRVNNEPHRYGGKGLAIGGICAGGLSLVVLPLLIAILLPAVSRAREGSKRVLCGANMRSIGTAMLSYADDWGNEFPPTFETLVETGEVAEKTFLCPSSDATLGDLHSCYEYIAGQTTGCAARNVLVYETAERHEGGGGVFFLDGSVEFLEPYSDVEELVAETNQRIAEAKRRREQTRDAP
ncbi:MAG: H-X9-DG-CTERM domain-containing protein [Planctomycetota bacterium]